MYYFAYGSNMNTVQMTERCPNATLLGLATLHNYRLGFTIYSSKRKCGCADIVHTQNETVHGLLYSISETEMQEMDRYEGHPNHYQRIAVTVEIKGVTTEAQSYAVKIKVPALRPSKHYLGLIVDAAKAHNFPVHYIVMLESTKTCD